MATDFITMRCLKGDEWPFGSFKTYVNIFNDPITKDSIVFTCPVDHKFTLRQALSKGIFSSEQADSILIHARKLKVTHNNPDWPAEDFLPDNEVVALNVPCIKCGAPAKTRIGQTKPLCLKCRADWHNYGRDSSFCDLLTWGKASTFFFDSVFDIFTKNLPIPGNDELEKLLAECRKKARLRRKEKK